MVDKELIESYRKIVKPVVASRLFNINYENMGEQDKEEFERDFDEILDYALIVLKYKAQLSQEGTTKDTTSDPISRQAVSSWLKQYGQDVLHGKYKLSLIYIWKNLMELPSARPEIIRCRDCKYKKDHHYEDLGEDPYIKSSCECKYGLTDDYQVHDWDFCSRAEKR